MSALDEAIKHVDPPQKDEGWIEYGLMLLWSEIDGYEHVADNASEEIVGLREQLAALTQRLEAAEAERDALKEALKPFAKEGIGIYAALPDNMRMYLDNYDPTEDGNYGKTDLTIGDFRKAAALVGDA